MTRYGHWPRFIKIYCDGNGHDRLTAWNNDKPYSDDELSEDEYSFERHGDTYVGYSGDLDPRDIVDVPETW